MNFRLWLPQLDANDAFRRMMLLLGNFSAPISIERLYIYDFYLSNPPLLHKTKMPIHIRRDFSKISIRRPENSFLNYPPAPILFDKMSGVQKSAFDNIVGREFINIQILELGGVMLSNGGRLFMKRFETLPVDLYEASIIEFSCNNFARIGADDSESLRAATGLRRISL